MGDRFVHHVPFGGRAPDGRRQLFAQLVTYTADRASAGGPLADLFASLGHDKYEVLHDELSVLPLGPTSSEALSGALRIGAGAGWVRPASGYGLRRASRFARSLVHALCTAEGQARPETVREVPLLDRVFLRVVAEDPTRLADLFRLMVGSGGDSDALVRFLEEDASAGDLAAVAGPLPAGPFVRAALREGLSPRRLAAWR